jgi:hypothetical protein
MSFLITHFWEGGTQEQYDAIIARAHRADGSLPPGQLHHFAGPTEGGFLVVALWETREQNDAFQQQLFPPRPVDGEPTRAARGADRRGHQPGKRLIGLTRRGRHVRDVPEGARGQTRQSMNGRRWRIR